MEHYLESELIILEVEKYPYLYDTSHNEFKNRELKRDAWMAVTKNVIGEKWYQMDENRRFYFGKEVQKRWKSMKDSFLKSIKNDTGISGVARKTKKRYVYHKQMAFLRALYQQKETLENMKTEEGMNTKASKAPAVRTKEPAIVAGPSTRMSSKRKSDLQEEEIPPKANLEQHTQRVTQDPDEMFLLSQLPQIKKMTPSNKLQFQIQFMQLIQKYCNPNPNSLECHYRSTPSPVNSELSST